MFTIIVPHFALRHTGEHQESEKVIFWLKAVKFRYLNTKFNKKLSLFQWRDRFFCLGRFTCRQSVSCSLYYCLWEGCFYSPHPCEKQIFCFNCGWFLKLNTLPYRLIWVKRAKKGDFMPEYKLIVEQYLRGNNNTQIVTPCRCSRTTVWAVLKRVSAK